MNFKHLCTPQEHRLSRRQWLGSVAAGALASRACAARLRRRTEEEATSRCCSSGSMAASASSKAGTRSRTHSSAAPSAPSRPPCPASTSANCCRRPRSRCTTSPCVRSLCTKDNPTRPAWPAFSAAIRRTAASSIPFFGSAVAKLLGPGDSGLPPYVWIKPGSGGFVYQDAGFLGPQVRRAGLRRRQAARKPAAAQHVGRPSRRRATATSCATWPTSRYAERRRKEATEANSYVYDMAGKLHEAQGHCSTPAPSPRRTWSVTARTTWAGTCCSARRMLEGRRHLRQGQLLRLGHARRQLQRPRSAWCRSSIRPSPP